MRTVTANEKGVIITDEFNGNIESYASRFLTLREPQVFDNYISLGKTVIAFPVSGLTVGKDYAFTVKTFDTSLNYSVGETVVKRIQSKDDPVNPVDPDKPNDPVDTTPPASVTNLSAVYNAETLQITVSWKNPTDLDFAGTQLVYGKVSSADYIAIKNHIMEVSKLNELEKIYY